jgi:farnesyl-diphosphate farnesyltransferase
MDPLLLRRVSRSFSLSLSILPRSLRSPIGLAYLIARAADTVADTRLVARDDRLARLRELQGALSAPGGRVALGDLARAQASPAERELLERLPECLAWLDALPDDDAARVRSVLATITDGQAFDLERFPGEDAASLAALDTRDDLDRYTYLVAGCVGEFWTDMHLAHRPRLAGWDATAMRARGVRFGKALQMTNVLRDAPRDLLAGRCYFPARDLAEHGLRPVDLLDPTRRRRAHPVLDALLRVALDHYEAAWQYTLAIPLAETRMRLACTWPLLIGLGTLERLAASPDPLDPVRHAKLSRGDVRGILARSALTVWSNRSLAGDAARLRRRIAV